MKASWAFLSHPALSSLHPLYAWPVGTDARGTGSLLHVFPSSHKLDAMEAFLFAACFLCAALFLDIVRLMPSVLHGAIARTCRQPLGMSLLTWAHVGTFGRVRVLLSPKALP